MKLTNVFVAALCSALAVSCSTNNTGNTSGTDSTATTKDAAKDSLPDISGYYRLPETGCNIALSITKEIDGYKYYFKGEQLDIEGTAIVSKEPDGIYVTFDGPIGGAEPKTVSGLFSDKTITIQNSGNADNNYHYFECEEKFLVFSKN